MKAGKKLKGLAGTTGLEPATSDVTGRRSNQLNYVPIWKNVGQADVNTTSATLEPTGDRRRSPNMRLDPISGIQSTPPAMP